MSEPIIEIRGLRKTFGQGEAAVTALDGIDLSIEKGEIFGIIGLSGAGKSTLVRCMNLLETPRRAPSGWTGRTSPPSPPRSCARPGSPSP